MKKTEETKKNYFEETNLKDLKIVGVVTDYDYSHGDFCEIDDWDMIIFEALIGASNSHCLPYFAVDNKEKFKELFKQGYMISCETHEEYHTPTEEELEEIEMVEKQKLHLEYLERIENGEEMVNLLNGDKIKLTDKVGGRKNSNGGEYDFWTVYEQTDVEGVFKCTDHCSCDFDKCGTGDEHYVTLSIEDLARLLWDSDKTEVFGFNDEHQPDWWDYTKEEEFYQQDRALYLSAVKVNIIGRTYKATFERELEP